MSGAGRQGRGGGGAQRARQRSEGRLAERARRRCRSIDYTHARRAEAESIRAQTRNSPEHARVERRRTPERNAGASSTISDIMIVEAPIFSATS